LWILTRVVGNQSTDVAVASLIVCFREEKFVISVTGSEEK